MFSSNLRSSADNTSPGSIKESDTMFTGLIEEIGTITNVENQGDSLRVFIGAQTVLDGTRHGDSISVNGVCLTVVDQGTGWWAADVMQETLDRSSLATIEVGTRVNLERAVAVGDRLGGHIVQGHVDATAQLISRTESQNWVVLRFELPTELRRYVVEKGSIALDGTSLTVSAVGEDYFEVSLIPETLSATTHGQLREGQVVNVEVDMIAKYVEKLVAPFH